LLNAKRAAQFPERNFLRSPGVRCEKLSGAR
jgi:hypothetical protein